MTNQRMDNTPCHGVSHTTEKEGTTALTKDRARSTVSNKTSHRTGHRFRKCEAAHSRPRGWQEMGLVIKLLKRQNKGVRNTKVSQNKGVISTKV